MYDLDDDDKISREELLAVLHMMVGSNISENQVCCYILYIMTIGQEISANFFGPHTGVSPSQVPNYSPKISYTCEHENE